MGGEAGSEAIEKGFFPSSRKDLESWESGCHCGPGKILLLSQGFLQDEITTNPTEHVTALLRKLERSSQGWEVPNPPIQTAPVWAPARSRTDFLLRHSLAERDCPGASVGTLPGANITARVRSSFWYTFNYFLISLALLQLYFHAWVAAVIDQHQDFLHPISGEKVLLNH